MPGITTTPVTSPPPTAGGGSTTAVDKKGIADNFNTFLTLLTTQLQHQDPTNPLDTNQFTQQLVQFAQVEQQIKQNDQLASLIKLDQTAQSTTALAFVGATVVVDGSTAQFADGKATWSFDVPKPSSVDITISDSTGQTAFTQTITAQPGGVNYVWDGHGNDGTQWPPGSYTLTATAKDASGQSVAISTQIQGVVDAADLSKSPPTLFINGQEFTPDKILKVVLPHFPPPPPAPNDEGDGEDSGGGNGDAGGSGNGDSTGDSGDSGGSDGGSSSAAIARR
jgi:flagellar basal-body rod modification protein FlgD